MTAPLKHSASVTVDVALGDRAYDIVIGRDVLASLGVKLDLTPAQVGRCVAEAGIGFMFAPSHHPAMKNVGPTRVELATRTIFNLLGPLVVIAFPILIIAKLIYSWSTTGFDLNDFIRAIIAIAAVWIVGSVASFIMGRSLYGVTVSDKR